MPSGPAAPRFPAKVAVALVLATAAGIGLTSTEGVVERSFVTALQTRPPLDTRDGQHGVPVAGSEEFWLKGIDNPNVARTSLPPRLGIGSTFTLAFGPTTVELEVVDISESVPTSTRTGSRDLERPRIVITCRDRARPDGRLMSFTLEADAPAPFPTGLKAQRTL